MRYSFEVRQTFEGAVERDVPEGFELTSSPPGKTTVVAQLGVEADTLPEAFAQAVDQFTESMMQAGWAADFAAEGITVVQHRLPERLTP